MIRIKNILVPTDLSDHAAYALNYARELASTYQASLHLLNVLETSWASSVSFDFSAMIAESLPEYQQAMQARLDAVGSEIEGIDVSRAVETGSPHAAIVSYAKNNDIDLIVIATHGRTGLSHALIGSVAEKVVQMAPCPVLTIKHPEHEFALP